MAAVVGIVVVVEAAVVVVVTVAGVLLMGMRVLAHEGASAGGFLQLHLRAAGVAWPQLQQSML